jgi:toxin ParE1/3/4
MTIVYSKSASAELRGVWEWNADRYGPDHANRYLAFLSNRLEELAQGQQRGHAVPGEADVLYHVARKRTRGHGHVLVYRKTPGGLHVAHVFHTAQDWPTRLRERPIE